MNIWQIQQDLKLIEEEIEENGGELTPELEEKLAITHDEFQSKVESYVNVIKDLDGDIQKIKVEQDRLKTLKESKQKTIDRLKKVILDAVNSFGDTNNRGVKFVDYGTGRVSVRNSKAVEINEENIELVRKAISYYFNELDYNNQLDTQDRVTRDDLIALINSYGIDTYENDIDNLTFGFKVSIPFGSLIKNPNAYAAIKGIINYDSNYELESKLSKSEIKPIIEQKPMLCPDIAVIKNNQSITIK